MTSNPTPTAESDLVQRLRAEAESLPISYVDAFLAEQVSDLLNEAATALSLPAGLEQVLTGYENMGPEGDHEAAVAHLCRLLRLSLPKGGDPAGEWVREQVARIVFNVASSRSMPHKRAVDEILAVFASAPPPPQEWREQVAALLYSTDPTWGSLSEWLPVADQIARLGPPPQVDVDGLVEAVTEVEAFLAHLEGHGSLVFGRGKTLQPGKLRLILAALSTYQASQAGEGSGEIPGTASTSDAVTSGQPLSPGPINCTHVLRREGKAYPRTCERCGLGPCPFYNNDGSVRP